MVHLSDILAARQRIAERVHRTPLHRSETLSRETGVRLHFKMELFQKTGSFKVRGVMNKLSCLSDEERAKGVISMSSGNHAQALSFGARTFGIKATIVMPSWSRKGKVAATRDYGGNVILTDEDLMAVCSEVQEETGATFVHPFDDPVVIAGQGTVGLEILEDVERPDSVFVTIGGGGLISGVATAIKESCPDVRIVGVEPKGAAAMSESLRVGKPVRLDRVDTIADGLAAPFAGEHCLAHVSRYVDELVTVQDEEIVEAMAAILERCKVVAEPSAAAALTPILSGQVSLKADETVVCVLCGGNVDCDSLGALLTGRNTEKQ